MRNSVVTAILLLTLTGCATNTRSVDMNEPRRVVGTENDVRVDAQIFGERLSTSTTIPVKYDITNQRSEAIAIADLLPEVTYDPDTQTVTVSIGAEVPGAELLPRLIAIAPGEKKSFSTVARVNILVGLAATPNSRFPNALRLKINFLSDTTEFKELIAMITAFTRAWNDRSSPFVWVRTADEILARAVRKPRATNEPGH